MRNIPCCGSRWVSQGTDTLSWRWDEGWNILVLSVKKERAVTGNGSLCGWEETNKRKMIMPLMMFSSFIFLLISCCPIFTPHLFRHQREHHTHERMKRLIILIRSAPSSSPCSLGVKKRWKEGTKKTNQIHRQNMTRGRMKGGKVRLTTHISCYQHIHQ